MLQSRQQILSYKFFLHFAKKASIGICFPPLEDFSFFLGEGVVVEHCFSASFFLGEGVVEHCFSASLAKKTDNGAMKQPFMFKQGRKLKFIKLINQILQQQQQQQHSLFSQASWGRLINQILPNTNIA